MPKAPAIKQPTPDEARALLEQDSDIRLKHVTKDGKLNKPLSPTLRRQLQSIAVGLDPQSSDVAKNFRTLCKAVGCSHTVLYQWKKKAPVSDPLPVKDNGNYSIAAVKEWLNRQRGIKGDNPEQLLSPKDQLAIAQGQVKLRRQQFQLGIETREYVTREEVNSHLDTANAVVTRELVKAFVHELPPLQEGLTAAEIQVMNEDRLKEILSHLPQRIKEELLRS